MGCKVLVQIILLLQLQTAVATSFSQLLVFIFFYHSPLSLIDVVIVYMDVKPSVGEWAT